MRIPLFPDGDKGIVNWGGRDAGHGFGRVAQALVGATCSNPPKRKDRLNMGFLDDLPDLDLDSLPKLGFPDPPQQRRPKADPPQENVREPPQWGNRWPAICARFDAARDQVRTYFTKPKIEEYWVKQVEQVEASAGSTHLFPKLPQ